MKTDGKHNGLARYALAVIAVAAGALLRLALTAWVGPGLPIYITFYPAVMAAALMAGLGPGLVATALLALLTDYWLLPPAGFGIVGLRDAVGLSLFAIVGVAISVVVGLYRRIRDRLVDLVAERTKELNDTNAALQQLNVELERRVAEVNGANAALLAARKAAINVMEDAVVARRQAEEANTELRESEERLRRAQEISHLGSWELDLARNELTWSDEVYRIFGLQPREVGATYEAFLERIHPDDRAAVDAAYSGSLREGRDAYDIEHRVIRKDTGKICVVHERCLHIRDASGRIVRSVGMVHDITERKLVEKDLERTAAELIRSNKDLEQFAYATSHDLKEPLRMVTSFMSLLKERYSGKIDAKADEYIGFAVDAAARMQGLVDDLLAYSRAGREKSNERVDVATAVDKALSNLGAALRESGAVITRDPLPMVNANAMELGQIFQNLIGNAIKFRRPDVKPEIHIGVKRVSSVEGPASAEATVGKQGEEDVKQAKTVASGFSASAPLTPDTRPSEWRFAVRDNGIGIAPQYHGKLFTIFHRLHTREEYPGTGIGLAICKKIVERYGGRIWVESEEGKGATFFFTLPA